MIFDRAYSMDDLSLSPFLFLLLSFLFVILEWSMSYCVSLFPKRFVRASFPLADEQENQVER